MNPHDFYWGRFVSPGDHMANGLSRDKLRCCRLWCESHILSTGTAHANRSLSSIIHKGMPGRTRENFRFISPLVGEGLPPKYVRLLLMIGDNSSGWQEPMLLVSDQPGREGYNPSVNHYSSSGYATTNNAYHSGTRTCPKILKSEPFPQTHLFRSRSARNLLLFHTFTWHEEMRNDCANDVHMILAIIYETQYR